jgi:hypothetical protein
LKLEPGGEFQRLYELILGNKFSSLIQKKKKDREGGKRWKFFQVHLRVLSGPRLPSDKGIDSIGALWSFCTFFCLHENVESG